MESSRRNRRSRLNRSTSNQLKELHRHHGPIESLEQRLLLRTPIPDIGNLAPAKPGPHDHAAMYLPPDPLTGQQRWPLNFDASHIREVRPDLVGHTNPPDAPGPAAQPG